MTAPTPTCRYPGCRGSDDEPRRTPHGMCDPGCQRSLHRDLGRIVQDWVYLREQLPAPLQRERVRASTGAREYGHPAEWASDAAAAIAGMLHAIHDNLAEQLAARRPPPMTVAEATRVRAAWAFLNVRIDKLAAQSWSGETAAELRQLHNQIRARIGLTRPRHALPAPCPRCEHRTLVRTVDTSSDQIDCGNCGHTISDNQYAFYTRLLLDTLIAP